MKKFNKCKLGKLEINALANEKCSKKNTCARYLDVLPFELYWFSTFPDTDCDYYIEKINEATTTKQLTLF